MDSGEVIRPPKLDRIDCQGFCRSSALNYSEKSPAGQPQLALIA